MQRNWTFGFNEINLELRAIQTGTRIAFGEHRVKLGVMALLGLGGQHFFLERVVVEVVPNVFHHQVDQDLNDFLKRFLAERRVVTLDL